MRWGTPRPIREAPLGEPILAFCEGVGWRVLRGNDHDGKVRWALEGCEERDDYDPTCFHPIPPDETEKTR